MNNKLSLLKFEMKLDRLYPDHNQDQTFFVEHVPPDKKVIDRMLRRIHEQMKYGSHKKIKAPQKKKSGGLKNKLHKKKKSEIAPFSEEAKLI